MHIPDTSVTVLNFLEPQPKVINLTAAFMPETNCRTHIYNKAYKMQYKNTNSLVQIQIFDDSWLTSASYDIYII